MHNRSFSGLERISIESWIFYSHEESLKGDQVIKTLGYSTQRFGVREGGWCRVGDAERQAAARTRRAPACGFAELPVSVFMFLQFSDKLVKAKAHWPKKQEFGGTGSRRILLLPAILQGNGQTCTL